MLTNSLKILDTIKAEFFELILFLSDQKLWQKFSHADSSIVSDPLTFSLSISVVTRCFLGIYVTRSLAVYNLWKKILSEAHILSQSIPNSMQILKMEQKVEKIFFGFEIIAFELVALDTRSYWERILVIGCQYINKQSQDFRYY